MVQEQFEHMIYEKVTVEKLAYHLFWKLNALIQKAKVNAKRNANPATADAATQTLSCSNPK